MRRHLLAVGAPAIEASAGHRSADIAGVPISLELGWPT
jgi:hypothetical protein